MAVTVEDLISTEEFNFNANYTQQKKKLKQYNFSIYQKDNKWLDKFVYINRKVLLLVTM